MAKSPMQTGIRAYWQEQLDKARKATSDFIKSGDAVIDRYRMEKQASLDKVRDRYNILYSSTETIKPSLYAQTPKVQVTKRHLDRKNPLVGAAVQMLESTITYAIEENDLDEVMNNAVEDYSLPGIGIAWVRYDPTFKDEQDGDGKPVNGEDGKPRQIVDYEKVSIDYVHWKDGLFGPCRFFRELPWGARRVYMGKKAATKRFGEEKANRLQYSDQNLTNSNKDNGAIVEDKQAEIWEIWDKTNEEVIWFSDGYAEDVLDRRPDPLKLKNFFPFPKPMRAITNTRTFLPRPLFSQYQAQAEELDNLTQRIRYLSEALYVRGVYDQSQQELGKLLARDGGNKMIPVENWAMFQNDKGITGSIQFLPLKDVVECLMRLYEARTNVKNEIYEITGFSDITRGLSKASETLGAQEIKNDWASGRLRIMQKEVQRFARDIMRLVGEIQAEHFSVESFALYSGFELPPPAPPAPPQPVAPPQPGQPPAPPPPDPRQQALEMFKATVNLLKNERERCAQIGIETDSTILPDEAKERKDRMDFLGAIGAFLQQAAPTVQQFPQMAGLLGAIMMFTVRTFRASRPIEEEFEKFQQALEQMPPQAQNDGAGDAAKAQAQMQIAQMNNQHESDKQDKELAFKASEADKDRMLQREQAQFQAQQAAVQLQIKEVELQIKQAELGLKQQQAANEAQGAAEDRALARSQQGFEQATGVAQMGHDQQMELDGADRQDRQFEASREDAAADREIQAQQSTDNTDGG
jgi:hypothetical protein